MFVKIKDSNKINVLLKTAKKIHSKNFVLFFSENHKLNNSEIVIIVPKKHFKKAVIRNKIKRQITAILIQTKILEKMNKHYSLILMIKATYEINSFMLTQKHIINLFQKLGG